MSNDFPEGTRLEVGVVHVVPAVEDRAGGDTVKQTISLVQSIDSETAKKITTFVRDQKLKKVKTQVQGDAVRVTGSSRDELQTVIRSLKEQDWDVELSFGNYR